MKLHVDIWSDVVCPWCAIGKRRFESALARFAHKDDVEVVFRAFELDPSAPKVDDGDSMTRLAKKYGMTREQAVARTAEITEVAAREGLTFDLIHAKRGNSFDAHRVLHLAAERGVQGAVKERLMRGYMEERAAIGDPEVLVRLASEAGLEADDVRATLASDRFAGDVREEEDVARRIGIGGVPFFLMGGVIAVSGAQPADVMLRALDEAWARAGAKGERDVPDQGASCGPDGCD